ncbi:AAA family ATPase [Malonomonas rubra]|uniref:AAA family ATPase n=1 Tax=Malonomonas rubra TaxID=57040 RepID=UPI00137ABE9A|nr:ATP-binding protein [Malonomonas rubra]
MLAADAPFCNRVKEQQELKSYALAKTNVVIFSPRRYGKTSLVDRVQNSLAEEGAITIYADFYGVSSIADVAAFLAKAVFKVTSKNDSLFNRAMRTFKSFRPSLVARPDEKSGFSLSLQVLHESRPGLDILEETLDALGTFIAESDQLVHIVLDEFQEITKLSEVLQVEGVMRQHIQRHDASYFFVGSRRSLLLSMFNERQRPFYQSALNYELAPLPREEFAAFIEQICASAGKLCDRANAELIVDTVNCYPLYAQKLAFFSFNTAEGEVVDQVAVEMGIQMLIKERGRNFEETLAEIPVKQVALLRALAIDPTTSLYSQEYMKRHDLGSQGAIQNSVKKLVTMDLIEKDAKEIWRVVDPVLALWLRNQFG